MDPDQTMVKALAAVVAEWAREAKKRTKKARRKRTDALVHDDRTALRRLRVALCVMGSTVYRRSVVVPLEQCVHDIEDALGPTRDADVLLADVIRYGRAHGNEAEALRPLIRRLEKRRSQSARRMHERLSSARARRTFDAIERFLERGAKTRLPRDPSKAVPLLVRHFLRHEIWRGYDELLSYDTHVPADYASLHRIRAAARRLRYRLELFEGALGDTEPIASQLRQVQDELGDLHDHHVAVTTIEDLLAEGKVNDGEEVLAYVQGRREGRARALRAAEPHWRALLGASFRAKVNEAVETVRSPAEPPNSWLTSKISPQHRPS